MGEVKQGWFAGIESCLKMLEEIHWKVFPEDDMFVNEKLRRFVFKDVGHKCQTTVFFPVS